MSIDKKPKKYHILTEQIFAQCGVYFRDDCKKQAKDEIDGIIFKYIENIEKTDTEEIPYPNH